MSTPTPLGFSPIERRSPFTDLIGPIYGFQDDAGLVLAITVEAKHCNARGFVHGGVLSTLADIAMGYNAVLQSKQPTGLVTANLTLDFAGSAHIGDWLSVTVDVQKVGGTLAFANCYFSVAGERIAPASAVFCKPQSKSNAKT